jgi:hypothetical protein
MLRPGNLLALSLRGTFVDTLLRKDFSVRRHPSYGAALVLTPTGLSPARHRVLGWARRNKKLRVGPTYS